MSEERRLQRIAISTGLLAGLLTGTLRVTAGLPAGAQIVSSGYDWHVGYTYVILHHESFNPVEPGEMIPLVFLQLTTAPQAGAKE